MIEGDKLREESRRLKSEVRKQTTGYILTALGLVAGLAWNDAIKSLIGKFIHTDGKSVLAQFIYAAIITLVVVLVSIYILKPDSEQK